MWNIPSDSTGIVSQGAVQNALKAKGIPVDEFLIRVTIQSTIVPENIQLLRDDGIKVQVAIQCVFGDTVGTVVGRLLRFRVQSDTSSLDHLIEQILAARMQLSVLSKRELEILDLVYEGCTNKAISISKGISEKTVEKHRARMMCKLGLNCTAMLVRLITIARMLPSPMLVDEESFSEDNLPELHHHSSTGVSFQPPKA